MKVWTSSLALISIFLLSASSTNAQGSPAPGSGAPQASSPTQSDSLSKAPPPGSSSIEKKDFPTSKNATLERIGIQEKKRPSKSGTRSIYSKLPITPDDAKSRLDELSARLESSPTSALAGIKNEIFALSEWLQDVASAHWKMYKAFDKTALTKEKGKSEREIALTFSHLKNRAKLLKADLYIKQNRYPEALGPLVDIVVAEPSSDVGKEAYKRLCDMGFSKSIQNLEIATSEAKGNKK